MHGHTILTFVTAVGGNVLRSKRFLESCIFNPQSKRLTVKGYIWLALMVLPPVMENINRSYKRKSKRRKIVLNELKSGSPVLIKCWQWGPVELWVSSPKNRFVRAARHRHSSVGGWPSSREEFRLFFDKLTDKPAMRHCQGGWEERRAGTKDKEGDCSEEREVGWRFFENWRVIEFYGGGPSSSVTWGATGDKRGEEQTQWRSWNLSTYSILPLIFSTFNIVSHPLNL